MRLRTFSRRNNSLSVDRRAGHRVLRLERLEDRRLLSVGLGPSASASNLPQISSVAAQTATYAVPVADAAVNTGPTISMVVVSLTQQVITWNAIAPDGVASSSLTVDGLPVSKIYGPYTASSGKNFAGVYGGLLSGDHNYVITAADNAGRLSQYTGTFSVTGPTISLVAISADQQFITWNAADALGLAGVSLTINGAAVSKIYGPYTAPSGMNYAGVWGPLSSGSHTYVITATNTAGNFSQYTGTVSVPGPTISMVTTSVSQQLITWNVAGSIGTTNTSLMIDNVPVTNIYGPYTAPSGLNYAGVYGSLSTGGHTYVITATDTAGHWSQYAGTLTVGTSTAGPTINQVVVSQAQGLITWNAMSPGGVASSSITIDGTTVPNIYGPYKTASGLNFAGAYGSIVTGTHAYVITATDNAGNSSQYTGTFFAGPTISSIVVSPAQGVVTWNVADPVPLASTTLTVDGTAVPGVYGPYAASSGANYAGVFGSVAGGSHSYVIIATDTGGNSAQYSGTFALGATINNVVVSLTQNLITWNTVAPAGVASTGLSIDGMLVNNISGPYADPVSGVDYAGLFGTLPIGNHTYIVTVIDNTGITTQSTGAFATS